MVKKKIRKFFNTVCIYEKTPVLFEEHRKKNTVIPWCTAFGIVVAAVAAIWLVMRELPERKVSES
jgi:hypothetical protein